VYLLKGKAVKMQFTVDRKSSQPIYSQLASWIETRINSGELGLEYKFLGEVELAETLGVSRGSLRKAISLLISKGLVVQIHGKGTFVGQPVNDQPYAGRLSVFQDLMMMGIPFETEVLEKRIMPAPEREAQILGISPAEAVFYLKRIRRVNEEPLVVHESFFPATRFGGLMKEDFTHSGMVETVERHYGITLGWTNNTISVARATTSISELLGLKTGDPVLFNESELFDEMGNHVETGLSWFRPDKFRLKTTVRRAQNEPFYTLMGRTDIRKNHPASADAPTRPIKAISRMTRLSEFLPVERISIALQVENWSEAILKVGRLLYKTGVTEERYGKAMVNTARQFGPYIVVAPGIAVAHALPSDGVIKPALALATLKPAIPFGHVENDPVKLLIVIAAVDTSQHVEALKDIADVLFDPIRREALMQAGSAREAFDILTKG
jgi:DNA-binding GntR family transcriptional regulator/mannitol/fructose-specific phosphotransferase system IIA component (Ntr-type)